MTRFRRGNTGGGDSGTVDAQVSANADDGFSTDAPNFDSTTVWSNTGRIGNGDIYETFLRFLNVTVPQGATIDVAYISVKSREENDGTGVKTDIAMEDSDDAVAPTTRTEHVNDVRTTALTAWDDASLILNAFNNSPSIADVVKEIVERGSWVSGNAMMILWDDDMSTTGVFYNIFLYENAPADAPKIHIEWST